MFWTFEKMFKSILRTFEFHEVKKVKKRTRLSWGRLNFMKWKKLKKWTRLSWGPSIFLVWKISKKNEKVNPEDISSLWSFSRGLYTSQYHKFIFYSINAKKNFVFLKMSFLIPLKKIQKGINSKILTMKKTTALRIPVWSPTTVLTKPFAVYLRGSDETRSFLRGMAVAENFVFHQIYSVSIF